MSDAYELRQDQRDHEYRNAWEKDRAFKARAERAGLKCKTERPGMAMNFEDNHTTASYTPDMGCLDTLIDQLLEKYGAKNEILIRSIEQDVRQAMEAEADRSKAHQLKGVVFCMVKCERKHMLASIHAFMHCLPGVAEAAGYPTLRDSGRHTGTSAEWIRKSRDNMCAILEVEPPPAECKSKEAKEKYKTPVNGHWRKQKYSNNKDTKLCQPTHKTRLNGKTPH